MIFKESGFSNKSHLIMYIKKIALVSADKFTREDFFHTARNATKPLFF